MSDHSNTCLPVKQRLRREARALGSLARSVPIDVQRTDPALAARLHAVLDRYALVWRDLARELGRSTDAVFPPTDDPAMVDVPVDRRPAGGAS